MKTEYKTHLSKYFEIKYYLVPWDSQIFGYPVLEILELILNENKDSCIEQFNAFLNKLIVDHNIKNICIKIPVESFFLVNILQNIGFKYIESTIVPFINLDNINEEKFQSYVRYEKRLAVKDDLDALYAIARNAFKFDRFHLDPNFDSELADYRYVNWVNSSFKNNEIIDVAISNGDIAGFWITEHINEKKAVMKLGCVSEKYRGMGVGLSLQSDIVLNFKNKGVNLLESAISLNNIPIFNQYVLLGFKFKNHKATFHKWMN